MEVPSTYVFILAACCLAELFVGRFRRRHPDLPSFWTTLVLCFFRPWAAVAIVNLVVRVLGNIPLNRLTYPFYANAWLLPRASFVTYLREVLGMEGARIWLPYATVIALLIVAAAFHVCKSRHANASAGSARNIVMTLLGLYLASVAFFISLASVPKGFFGDKGQQSSFLDPWQEAGTTMLYADYYIRPRPKDYLRDFHHLQNRMDLIIHAKSHPPMASLFVRWIGQLAGADTTWSRKAYRDPVVKLRYAIGQTAVSALNILLIFAIGAAMFDRRTGLFASVLWVLAPSVTSYATFAPDMNYALFFNGALLFTWLTATSSTWRRAMVYALPLGLCFAMLVLMNFSWCIVTTDFAVFLLLVALRERRGWRDFALRAAPALTVMTLAAGYVIVHYGIRYFTIYQNSVNFVAPFYTHKSFTHMLVSLVGGQVEWLFLIGPAACSLFFMFLCGRGIGEKYPLQRLVAIVLLAVFALPVLFGPPCLKHEVARCWIWMASVPIVLAARFCLDRAGPLACSAVAASSAATAILLRVSLVFLS